MTALYSEWDPYVASWLRNLIAAGHIAPGVVDERSIVDLEPDYLRGFTQCHFFAGIGVWSHALRLAGWPDDRSAWTGSCPCQPFSAAGKGKGHEDERHLWPAWQRLIRECAPPAVFGEQVASADGLGWLDVVLSDLEAEGYAVAAADLSAAGYGAPHIRQRLFFVAHAHGAAARQHARELHGDEGQHEERPAHGDHRAERGSAVGGTGPLADAGEGGREILGAPWLHGDGQPGHDAAQCGEADLVGDAEHARLEGHAGHGDGARGRALAAGSVAEAGASGSFWSDADWIPCRDGKARPVEPGTFPLAHGATARVGRLRAYGNAIVAQAAAAFIEASGV